MFGFQSQKSRKSNLSRLTIIVLTLIVLWLSKSVYDVYQKSQITKHNRQRAVSEVLALEERQQALKDKIERLETDDGKEAEIRRNLSVVKEGEKLIVIVDQPATSTGTTTKPSSWQRWFGI